MKRTERVTCRRCQGQGTVERISGAWLAWLRERAGLSLRGMERRVGLPRSYLHEIERGKRPCSGRALAAYESLGARVGERSG